MNLPNNYKYNIIDKNTVRSNLKCKEEVEQWVNKLQEISKNTWYITRTIITPGEKAKKNVFKRVYHCHFKTKKNQLRETRKRDHSSRNIDCPAELIIIIKKQDFKQKTKSKFVDDLLYDWPCVITFKNDHNHTINSAAALTKRPIAVETKQEILQLFEKGHSVASAYNTFCFSKMEELGDQYDELVSDRHFFPSKSDFSNLWKANFKRHYGARSGEKMFDQLEENLKQNGHIIYKVEHIHEDYAVSLCTPIMQRAAKYLIQSSEILFVDATSNCDVQNHKLYFFATQSAAGGIPLGCVITSSQKSSVFDIAVKNLIDIMPTKILPAVIITDDDLTERSILKKYWSTSTLLLCTFHVLKAVWKWLQLAKNEIKKEDRQFLYQLFRNILMSKTEEQMKKNLEIFDKSFKYPQYKKYINVKIENISSWCLYYRQTLMIRGADTNNYVEVMFRLFKDISLERTKAYNLTQLTDFIVSSFDNYYKQRLLDLIMKKLNKATINRLSPDDKNVLPSQITELGEMQYYVSSSCNEELKYFVDMRSNVCTCPEGITGKICKHQSSVIKAFNITDACNTLSLESQKTLYFIATGSNPPQNMLLPLRLEDCATKDCFTNDCNINHCAKDDCAMDDVNDECSSSTKDICTDVSELNILNSNVIEQWNDFIQKFDSNVRRHLEDDPRQFIPAVESLLKNYQKNVINSSTLMSGLYNAFKSDHLPRSLTVSARNTPRRGKKISVQPTSVTRRRVKITGRRSIQAGRKVGNLTAKKTKAPHSLSTCVTKNVGLGENKFAK